MASIQSSILKSMIKRQGLFASTPFDPTWTRVQLERMVRRSRPRRGVRVVPVQADAVPAEWLIPQDAPEDRVLLYLHGGAWCMGSTNSHRTFVSTLAHASGVRALSIDYRLAPEHPFPAGLEDCLAAYDWLLRNGIPAEKIIVGGDSAGGNLALALLVSLRDNGKPLPAGAVALSPATDLATTGESHKTRRHLDPLFGNSIPSTLITDYVTDHDPRHPLISPLYADLHGLPPLLIHVGDHEVLLDDAVRFAERAVAARVDARIVVWSEMFHVFQIFSSLMPEARAAVSEIATFIRSRLNENTVITKPGQDHE